MSLIVPIEFHFRSEQKMIQLDKKDPTNLNATDEINMKNLSKDNNVMSMVASVIVYLNCTLYTPSLCHRSLIGGKHETDIIH